MTLLSPSDDDIPSLIQEYNSMDPYLRSELLEAMGMTREGWRSMVSAYERQRRAAGRQRASTNASQAEGSSTSGGVGNESPESKAVVVAVRLPRATGRVELRFDAGGGNDNARPRPYSSAPPSSGSAATGPGRSRSGGGRRLGFRGRSDASVVIVIMLSEN
ncbi:hypothetical protein [Kitasatospora sp. NBC_01539]|uniref:hypothetical protein n=1 Tax=Kitasatospora sp. NBC_01539 TaxID=2903577 RepID=UPI0038600ED0